LDGGGSASFCEWGLGSGAGCEARCGAIEEPENAAGGREQQERDDRRAEGAADDFVALDLFGFFLLASVHHRSKTLSLPWQSAAEGGQFCCFLYGSLF
jgi:hypothetical protein